MYISHTVSYHLYVNTTVSYLTELPLSYTKKGTLSGMYGQIFRIVESDLDVVCNDIQMGGVWENCMD